jgi:signal transduction histidine kinase
MTGVLAVILAIALGLTYATLVQSAEHGMAQRLQNAAMRLGTLLEGSTSALRGRLRTAATNDTLHLAITGARSGAEAMRGDSATIASAAREILGRLLSSSDSMVTAELWTADGRRVAYTGRDLRSGVHVRDPARDINRLPVPHEGTEELAPSDSVQMGSLYIDDGSVYFWALAPVLREGTRMGYLARQYRLDGSSRADSTIQALFGSEVVAYFRNVSGDVWSPVSGGVASAPIHRDSTETGAIVYRAGVGELLAVEERIEGSPLVLTLEVPLGAALAQPRTTVLRLAVISGLLMLVGAAASWLVSRRITRPLADLTGAAASIAQGDYGARVQAKGDDELSRLAASFNRMAEEIGASRDELELQAEEALAGAEELERSNRQIEDARALAERAQAQAEAASRAKSEFLAVMSHELRTPLNAIGGYAELLELELRGPVTDAQRRDLSRIRASQQHLLGLVSGVLDLSRIEAGRVSYHLTTVVVDPFLSGLDALVEPQAAAKALTLEYVPCDPTLAVIGDQEKLRQVMLNLLSNAIRYTSAGGRITLSAEALEEANVAITVRDTGMGIPQDALDRIFEPFVQLDQSLTRTRDGMGLGLAISRDLARGMGGDLTVESQLGEGSTFTLRVPRAAPGLTRAIPKLSGDHPAVAR